MHPDLFCMSQDWYLHEPFAALDLTPLTVMPSVVVPCASEVCQSVVDDLTDAVLLVGLYVANPDARIWYDFLWCGDVDRHGQRIYIGGTRDGRGLQIHRHLHLTHRWSIPLWH